MADIGVLLAGAVGTDQVLAASTAPPDYGHDEALGAVPGQPAFVVRPGTTAEVAAVVQVAGEPGPAITARGSGTGLSGAAIPRLGGILVSFERMNRVLEIDAANHVAVIQPGVSLAAPGVSGWRWLPRLMSTSLSLRPTSSNDERVVDFLHALDESGRFPGRVLDKNDLVVLAVHDQSRDVEILEVAGEVGLREGLDALVSVLQPGLHAPEPELVQHALGDLGPRPVRAVELQGKSW